MIKRILPILLVLVCSCSSKDVKKEDLATLNGYWEIKEVVFSDGNKKEYTANATIDYISIKDAAGIRAKVYPKIDGSYTSTNDQEHFTITEKDGHFLMFYKSDLSEWTETIKSISKNTFSIENEENLIYIYKRYQPIISSQQ